jgi:hypothetical protein
MEEEKEAKMKPRVWERIPRNMGGWTPQVRVRIVARGEISMAVEKLRPPIKAKSVVVAEGKTLFWR